MGSLLTVCSEQLSIAPFGAATAADPAALASESCGAAGACAEGLMEAAEDASIQSLRLDLLQTDMVHQNVATPTRVASRAVGGAVAWQSPDMSLAEAGEGTDSSIQANATQGFPSLGEAFGIIGKLVGHFPPEQRWHVLATILNGSLGAVYKPVDELQGVCCHFRESVMQNVIQLESGSQQRRANFEAAVGDAVGKCSSTGLVIIGLLGIMQSVVPNALHQLGLSTLADSTDHALGALIDVTKGFQASLMKMPLVLAGLGNATEDAADHQLAALDESVQDVLATADAFSSTSLNTFTDFIETVAKSLGAPRGAFASSEETARGIAGSLLGSANQLAEIITEAHAVVAPMDVLDVARAAQ